VSGAGYQTGGAGSSRAEGRVIRMELLDGMANKKKKG